MPLVIGGILGAIVIIAIVIYMIFGGSAPKPEPGSGTKSPAATPPAATPVMPVVPTAPATPTPTPMTPPLAQPAP